MPTYQYLCTACEQPLEVVQGFNDTRLTECPACEGRLRQVFSAVGVVFKGSGFYRNDSRGKPKTESASSGGADSGSEGGSTSAAKAAETPAGSASAPAASGPASSGPGSSGPASSGPASSGPASGTHPAGKDGGGSTPSAKPAAAGGGKVA